jgi:hypothetical protein
MQSPTHDKVQDRKVQDLVKRWVNALKKGKVAAIIRKAQAWVRARAANKAVAASVKEAGRAVETVPAATKLWSTIHL